MDIVTLAASMKLNGGIAHYKNSVDILAKVLARDGDAIGGTLTLPEEIEELGQGALSYITGVTTLIAPGVTKATQSAILSDSSFVVMRFPKLTSITGDSPFYLTTNNNDSTLYLDALEEILDVGFMGTQIKNIILPAIKKIKHDPSKSPFGSCKANRIYLGPNCTEIDDYVLAGWGASGQALTLDCGFAQGTISGTNWYAGISGTVTVNYNVPIPT